MKYCVYGSYGNLLGIIVHVVTRMIHLARACTCVIRRISRYRLVSREFNGSSTGKWDGTKNATRTGRGYNGTMRCLQASQSLMFRDVTEMLICGRSSVGCRLRNTFPRSFPNPRMDRGFLYFRVQLWLLSSQEFCPANLCFSLSNL